MYTFSAADHTQITGRVLATADHHIAVASTSRGDGSGYVLAVRPDGAQYAVWTWYAGEDSRVCLTWGHYFDAADYRHLDRFGAGHTGAYAAAAAYFAEITATPAS
jgi:hypothetical protein